MTFPSATFPSARIRAACCLLWLGAAPAVSAFFSVDSPVAVVAEDPHAAARLQEALRRRFSHLHQYSALAAAQEAARESESGPVVALLVSSTTKQGASEAYGTSLSSCHVQLTVQVLRLPEGAFEYAKSRDARAPDCGRALAEASAGLSDELVKSLEGYRRQGVTQEQKVLWVEFADGWSESELTALGNSLQVIPGIGRVVREKEGGPLRLEVYREPRALAREIDRLAAVRLTRFAGDRLSLAHADSSDSTGATEAGATEAKVAQAAPLAPVSRGPRIPPATGRKWALVVGISNFQDPSIPTLSFPVKDATAFADVLLDREVGRFDAADVLVLLDGEATTRRIKTELDRLARRTKPEDLFLFYFSSHAVPGEHDAAGDAYLVTHDTEKMNLYATGMPMRELVDALTSRIRAQTVVSFLDACNTGQVVDRSGPIFQGAKALRYDAAPAVPVPGAPALSWSREWQALAKRPSVKALAEKPAAQVPAAEESEAAPAKRVVFISSSDGDQPSWESEALGHGFFTYYLMDVLQRSRGQATVKSIFDYLRSEVKRAVEIEKGAVQEPRMFFTYDADVVVGYPFAPH